MKEDKISGSDKFWKGRKETVVAFLTVIFEWAEETLNILA